MKTYVCECGKEFNSSQSFNAHKSHCRIHLFNKYGSDDVYNKRKEQSCKYAVKGSLARIQNQLNERTNKQLLWIEEQHLCERCGKAMTEKYGSGRFCCKSCACSRPHSSQDRQKISESLKNYFEIHSPHREERPQCIKHVRRINKSSILVSCKRCGKTIKQGKTGFCKDCFLSDDCTELRSEIWKHVKETAINNGHHYGFPSRNVTSYPEKFWITVLENNQIQYQKEYRVLNNHKSCYFLDFYIQINNINLDLEIDGKQHLKQDRIESDKCRDEFLTSLGYTIYRIPWNEINSESGKIQMKNKIDMFLQFYENLNREL